MEWVVLSQKVQCIQDIQDRRIMTIYNVKSEIFDHVGDTIKIKYNLGRNKYEEYTAVLKELYHYIFLVECETISGINYTKSFTYTDVLTHAIKIDY